MRNRILYLFASLVILSGCGNQPAYKNSNLSPEERAEDLLQQLTLEEKVALMMDNSKPVECGKQVFQLQFEGVAEYLPCGICQRVTPCWEMFIRGTPTAMWFCL